MPAHIDATRFLCVDGARPRDRRTTRHTKKFPPLHVTPQRAIVSGANRGGLCQGQILTLWRGPCDYRREFPFGPTPFLLVVIVRLDLGRDRLARSAPEEEKSTATTDGVLRRRGHGLVQGRRAPR
jgi:hypothetical protein